MTWTRGTLTRWRKPWKNRRFARGGQVIADHLPRAFQPRLALARAAAAPAAPPPGGARPAPPDAPERPAAAPCGSIEQAARKVSALRAPAQPLTGAGE
jgi:hypothetical protein